jgi:hypothetical protein
MPDDSTLDAFPEGASVADEVVAPRPDDRVMLLAVERIAPGQRDETTSAIFIFEALAPLTDDTLHAATDERVSPLTRPGPKMRAARRMIGTGDGS